MPENYEISAAARHTAETIMMHFSLLSKPGSRVAPTLNNLAILIDVCTSIFRVEEVLEHVVRTIPYQRESDLKAHLGEVQQALAMIQMVRDRIPRYGEPIKVPVWQKEGVQREISRAQRDQMEHMAKVIGGARTVEEEQRILQKMFNR